MSKSNLEIITLNKPGITNFATARNELLKKSKAEWAFFLDTDEVMSSKLRDEILQKIRDKNLNGYKIKRKNYLCGSYIGTDLIVRLGRKGKGKWRRPVHETWEIWGRIGKLENPVIHNTAKTMKEMVQRINFYSDLHAKVNLNEGKQASLFKIIIFPKAKFIQSLLMGRGVEMSIMQSFHSFLAWSKLWFLQKKSA